MLPIIFFYIYISEACEQLLSDFISATTQFHTQTPSSPPLWEQFTDKVIVFDYDFHLNKIFLLKKPKTNLKPFHFQSQDKSI